MYLEENGLRFRIDIEKGQKTGFYLDQRNHRAAVCDWVMGGRVLDAFCYSGGFGLNALKAGAGPVTFVDTSETALVLVQENLEINGFGMGQSSLVQADAFQHLRLLRDKNEQFETIILDPPKFAPTAATADRAARGYKDSNLLALKLLAPGGVLFTFSCSGGIKPERFQQIVAGAALDAGIDVQILAWFSQPPDHPVKLSFPESRYLKGLLCRRL
jgi:23S rRNA (cytosine1962-C5)-methyltransferase